MPVHNLLCCVFEHRRSKRHVRFSMIGWRTRCSRCGTTLIRAGKGWRVPGILPDPKPIGLRQRADAGPPQPAVPRQLRRYKWVLLQGFERLLRLMPG
jgi:hypothetical protein